MIKRCLALILLSFFLSVAATSAAFAQCDNGTDLYRLSGPDCKSNPVSKSCSPPCNCNCKSPIEHNHKDVIRPHVTHEFMKHRDWMIDIFFFEHILPDMTLMTDQLSMASVLQTQAIGRLFDAKEELETQQVLTQLMAEAHKDYQPSEGMCEIGTNTMSLAASERKSDMAQATFARRMMDRQLRSGAVLSTGGENSDIISRIKRFGSTHCDIHDNAAFGLDLLCNGSSGPVDRRNKDIDYTRTLESKLTLDADFVLTEAGHLTADEEDIFALTANLFAHTPLAFAGNLILATEEGEPRAEAHRYMDLRSVAAKRSVAQNSIASIAAQRAEGDPEVAQYLKRVVTELGVSDEDVHKVLGEKPSYFAQMEVLTKDIYQNPVFYTELYDKPANVTRKGVTLKALALMQDRDFYKSQLRSEALLSVLLETMLQDEHNRVSAQLSDLGVGGEDAE